MRASSCGVLLVGAFFGCGRGSTSASVEGAAASVGAADASARRDSNARPEDPRAADLWTRAKEGDLDDLARLHSYIGPDALVEESMNPVRRLTAIRALAFSDDFHALPFLATLATSSGDEEANVALEGVVTMANEPRRAVDPEDALELHDGCAQLLTLAKDTTRPAHRRELAVAALRAFSDRGWVPKADVPTDLDAR